MYNGKDEIFHEQTEKMCKQKLNLYSFLGMNAKKVEVFIWQSG